MIKAKISSRPESVFPFSKVFAGKLYHQSLMNPDFIKNCSKSRADTTAAILRKDGYWLVRVVKFDTDVGPVYLVYERKKPGAHKGVR